MKTSRQNLVCLCLISVVPPLSARPVQSVAPPLSAVPVQSIDLFTAKLESPDSSVRIDAFYGLFQPALGFEVNAKKGTLKLLNDHPEERIAISQALISLLSRENAIINGAVPGSLPETHGGYHASLILSVATLRDASAIGALLGAIKTGGLATDGLAALGTEAIPAVLKAMDSLDPGVRMGAMMVLGKMALQRAPLGLDAANIDTIRSGLLRGAQDAHYSVRWAAVLSLESFVDAEVLGAVQRAATVDTSEQVRQAANEWLSKHRVP